MNLIERIFGRKKRSAVPVKKKREYPWTPWNFDTHNPETFSLLRAGHGIILKNRFIISGSKELDHITVADMDNMEDDVITFEGITKENLNAAMLSIKNQLSLCQN